MMNTVCDETLTGTRGRKRAAVVVVEEQEPGPLAPEPVAVKVEFSEQDASRMCRARIADVKANAAGCGGFEDSRAAILVRYPRLVAHLICQSLGYFCPNSAAMAIRRHQEKEPMFCEWYGHMFSCMVRNGTITMTEGLSREEALAEENRHHLTIGRDTLAAAFENRHSHRGYMSDYWQARKVCFAELAGNGPVFASWF